MAWTEQDQTKKDRRVSASNRVMDARHRQWDLTAQDKTPKSARPHFAVVGEGSRTARENFLNGYRQIDWSS